MGRNGGGVWRAGLFFVRVNVIFVVAVVVAIVVVRIAPFSMSLPTINVVDRNSPALFHIGFLLPFSISVV